MYHLKENPRRNLRCIMKEAVSIVGIEIGVILVSVGLNVGRVGRYIEEIK